MRKIILSQGQFKHLIKVIKEQEEEYYKISPQELLNMLELGSYSSAVLKPKFFEGKKLYVTGSLDLSGKPIKTLGNIAYIDGNLSINNTNISSIEGVQVKGHIWDSGSPVQAKRIRQEELKKLAEAESRREDGDWELTNPNIDEEGLAANALFNHLVSEGKLDEMDDETKELLNTKIQQLEQLKIRYEDADGTLETEEVSPLFDEISDLEDEIEEMQEKYADVYYIIPTNYKSYGTLYNFEVIGLRNQEYMVGTYDDMYDAAIENAEQLLDEAGLDGINQYIIESNIDRNSIREYIEEFCDNDIRDSPESYFDSDDYELTDEQEERKEELERYINEMEDLKTEKEEEFEDTEDEDEKSKLKKEIEQIEENIEKAQDEFDSIEPDDEPTDEMIEEKVNNYVERAMDDPVRWLRSMGEDDRIKYFVNVRGVAEDIVDHDGIGTISSYDGRYDDVYITGYDGTKYTRYNFVVVRTN